MLVSHDNDGVTKFGLDLLQPRPAWLARDRPQPESVPGAQPAGHPARDAVAADHHVLPEPDRHEERAGPRCYRAWAHDYRPDLARFISEVFDLPASPAQLAAVEAALEQREHVRQLLFEPPEPAEPPGP